MSGRRIGIRERALDAVCACGCGTAIPSAGGQRLAHGHCDELARLRRDHNRLVARIRAIPVRKLLDKPSRIA